MWKRKKQEERAVNLLVTPVDWHHSSLVDEVISKSAGPKEKYSKGLQKNLTRTEAKLQN